MVTPKVTVKRPVGFKTEVTKGTAVSLAAADGIIHAFDPDLAPEIPISLRPGQVSMSQLKGIAGARGGRLTFESELQGDASNGPLAAYVTLFPAVALAATSGDTYAPTSAAGSMTTITGGVWRDGNLESIAGAMGNLEMRFTNGEPVRMAWDFLGVHQAEAAAALPSVSYPPSTPFVFTSATLTIGGGGYVPRISELTINLNNELKLREDVTNAAGYLACHVVNRAVSVTLDPELDDISTKSWMADLTADTEMPFSLALTNGASDTITISIPRLQITDVQPGDRDGIAVKTLTAQANTGGSGNDEIVFSWT